MKVWTEEEAGFLPARYGKQAANEDKYHGAPIVSLPIHIEDLPADTKFLALTFIDYDAVPVSGFPWIHWLAANIVPTKLIPADASRQDSAFLQGKNSYVSKFYGETDANLIEHYAGPTPPDQDHDYTLTIFALDKKLALKKGFYLNELLKVMDGHILAEEVVTIRAKA